MSLLIILPTVGLASESNIRWQRDIRPLFAAKCFACHGPDESRREAGLRLDDSASLRNRVGDANTPLVAPRHPERSLIWQRISSSSEDRMPPAPEHQPLSAEELAKVRAWIMEGAITSKHWSHRPIVRPQLPSGAAPWVRNEIDLLLQDGYGEGRRPRVASTTVLQRRLALTLTGLPVTDAELTGNTPSEIRRFVDELLASPRFGEHAAVAWLDVARYADTHGYHIDGHRDMWRWRDWVIDSFNQDMPFDQFTLLQLAGDLTPPAADRYQTMRHRLATGFLRNTPINSEDGAIAEEFLAEYAAERTIAVGAAWLGQTMQCCRCHDHKNDPITQREFYSLSAFFNDLPEKGIDGRHGNAAPTIAAPTWPQELRWRAALEQRRALQAEQSQSLAIADPKIQIQQSAWEQKAREAGPRPGPRDYVARLPLTEGEGRRLKGQPGPTARFLGTATWFPSPRRKPENATRLFSLALGGSQRVQWDLTPQDSFTIAAWVFVTTDDPMTLMSVGKPALELRLKPGGLALMESGNVVRDSSVKPAWPKRQWRLLSWSFANRTHRIAVDGQPLLQYQEPSRPDSRTGDERHRLETGLHVFIGGSESSASSQTGLRGILDEAFAFNRVLDGDALKRLASNDPLMRILAVPSNQRDDVERRQLRRAFLLAEDAAFARRERELLALERQLERMRAGFPRSMVMATGPVRATHVLSRGDYRRRGEQVERGTPAILPRLPRSGTQPTRRDLAAWLTSREHPLTARVVANRIWTQHFGEGLTATPDDLGLGGAAPTHPELLDLLADELLRSGWNQKHVHRMIVTSTAYLQLVPGLPGSPKSSTARSLSAEQLRDSALAVSGLLTQRVGGPSVFPYQPEGLWEELARDPNLYSAQTYAESDGEDLYRRSLYTFWKRSAPPPALQLLGAPSRETCITVRSASQGPQRALVLMNDPIFVEAARHVAEELLHLKGIDERIEHGVQRLFQRSPTKRERSVLREAAGQFSAQLGDGSASHRSAEQLVYIGRSEPPKDVDVVELAVWTAWVNLLMNTQEFETLP